MVEKADKRQRSAWILAVAPCAVLLAIVVGWWSLLEGPRRRINRSLALIESWGGRVETVSSLPEWLEPYVGETFVEEYWRWVVGIHTSHNVWGMSAEELDYLAPFRNLETLSLDFDLFDHVDAHDVLRHLPRNPDLVDVMLSGADWIPGGDQLPNLERLELYEPHFEDSSLRSLSSLEGLVVQDAERGQVDDLLREGRHLKHLRSVAILNSPIGPERLAKWQWKENLRSLSLGGWLEFSDQLGDEHVAAAVKNHHLVSVRFVGRNITPKAVQIVTTELPNLYSAEIGMFVPDSEPSLGPTKGFQVYTTRFPEGWYHVRLVRSPEPNEPGGAGK